MNELPCKALEIHMVGASAQLWLEELSESKPKEYLEGFYDGFMFRSEIISRLTEICFDGDDLD